MFIGYDVSTMASEKQQINWAFYFYDFVTILCF